MIFSTIQICKEKYFEIKTQEAKSKHKNKNGNSKVGKKMLQKGPSISHISFRNDSDDSNSDDYEYEDNIPLQVVQEGLNTMSRESLICGRKRIKKCLHKVRVIKCETQRELWDLDDYEGFAPETEHKVVRNPEYRSLGIHSFSPIVTKNRFVKY